MGSSRVRSWESGFRSGGWETSPCPASEWITENYGDLQKRTTNAMPYPRGTPPHVESFVKHFYAKSQFAATALAAFGCPMLSFGSVLAIQLASVLMTFVRKGLIESVTYHMVYGLSLFLMFPAMAVSMHFLDEVAHISVMRALMVCALSVSLRMPDFKIAGM